MTSFLKDVWVDIEFLFDSPCPVLWLYRSTALEPPLFLRRSQFLTTCLLPCTWWSIFLLLLSKFSLHFSCQNFDFHVSRCRSLCVYHIWDLLSLSDLQINVSDQIWEVFSHFLFTHFFLLFSLFPFLLRVSLPILGAYLPLSQRYHSSLFTFLPFFSLCSL